MYGVHINKDALKYVNSLAEKSERLIKRKLEILKEDPYPGRDDKKKLQLPDYDLFRMHVGRSFGSLVIPVKSISMINQVNKEYPFKSRCMR